MHKFSSQPILLISSNDDPPFLSGIIDECNALGWRVINLAYAKNYVDFHPKPIGAIFKNVPDASTVDLLRKKKIPIVCTSYTEAGNFKRDGLVLPNLREAGHIAASAFAERGFRNWGYITFETEAPHADPLFLGLSEQAERHGADLHLCSLAHLDGRTKLANQYEAQMEAIAQWLNGLPKPLAVLAFNYTMGVRIIAACDMAGISVPEQVAVACQGDSEALCRTAPIPMSAIDMNRTEIGAQAVRLMTRLVQGESPPRDPIYVPVKGFIERRSTDILAVSDPRVAKSVRFIWDHLKEPLSVDDVAHEAGISRSMLERAFRRYLNRGVNAELRRKRLERGKELLRGTRMTLADIADAAGMDTRHFHRSFKSAFGMTPKHYRLSTKKLNESIAAGPGRLIVAQ